MVKVGVFSDTHVGRSVPNIIGEYRRRAFRHAFTQAVEAFIREGVEYVLHAGDLFEKRSMWPSDSLFVKEELQRLVDSLGGGLKIIIVRGNHDGTPGSSALNYVEHPLAKYLTVVGERALQGEPELYVDGVLAVVGFGYTPYTSQRLLRVRDALREGLGGARAPYKILLAHMFIEGQGVPPGVPEYQVAPLRAVMDLGADMVIAGHNHKRLLMDPERPLLLTPGSTEAIDLSDEGPFGVHILDLGGKIECKFIQLEPLYRIKNVVVDSGGAVEQPKWFIEGALEAARAFSDELRSSGSNGILRLALRGLVDGNKFDVQSDLEVRLREVRMENLLHIEVDNQLDEVRAAQASLPERMSRDEFLREAFSALGEEKMAEALSLANEVLMSLEEKASPQTGLLKESDRRPFIERWLRILGE